MMLFMDPNARRQLMSKGEVYTYRSTRRVKVGPDCAAAGYDLPSFANIYIFERKQEIAPDVQILQDYVKKSGFGGINEWRQAIAYFHHGQLPMSGYLYHVVRRDVMYYCSRCYHFHRDGDEQFEKHRQYRTELYIYGKCMFCDRLTPTVRMGSTSGGARYRVCHRCLNWKFRTCGRCGNRAPKAEFMRAKIGEVCPFCSHLALDGVEG